jgi:hypothetical protein
MSFVAYARDNKVEGGAVGLRVSKPHDSFEQEADRVAEQVVAGSAKRHWSFSSLNMTAGAGFGRSPVGLARQEDRSGQPPGVERHYEVPPHVIPMNAPAVPEQEKCEELPGGATDCEVNEVTGIPTGKVTHQVDETNACTKPCVEQHEAVHVKQLKTFCPQLRDCYLAADKGKRPASECWKMSVFGNADRECSAYRVSVPCMEKRLTNAKECQSKENKAYGVRKLASEKCWRTHYCEALKK